MNKYAARFLPVWLAIAATPQTTGAQPTTLDPDLKISLVRTIPGNGIRIEYYEPTGLLYIVARDGGIWTIDPDSGEMTLVAEASDHGVASPQGAALTPDGRFFLVGNDRQDKMTTGIIVRGTIPPNDVAPASWESVATTEPFPLATNFNHLMNAAVVDPRGNYLYVNSGARTDHGEVQDNRGAFPGLREVPITSAVLRLPAGASGIELENDESFLDQGGFLFADGVRNLFDMAFDADDQLFGVENSGDRDDEDELNWLRKARHYGFPWRMGTHDTPQQFVGYDPASDALINPASGAAQLGLFDNDPTFPTRPEGITFTDPVPNDGPDLTRLRNPDTGAIEDASQIGTRAGTFTPHLSPLGLTFDRAGRLAAPYTRDGFVLSWTGDGSELFSPFAEVGEALFHLDLDYDAIESTFEVQTTRIVEGFEMPIDAVLVDTTLFVMEMRFGPPANLWALRFPGQLRTDPTVSNRVSAREDVSVHKATGVPFDAIRIDHDPLSGDLLMLTRSGDIHLFVRATGELDRVATYADHGVPMPRGLAIGSGGRLFLLGNDPSGNTTAGIVRRAVLDGGVPRNWETVATTDRYPLAGNRFDHLMTGLALSRDGRHLYISSGSRTDHGEVQANDGAFPDLREAPLTAVVLRIPADTVDMVIPGDEQVLAAAGWIFARGVRNAVDLAWGPEGRLFAVDDAGQRDDPEELNWIRQGKHYGFPWVIGGNETPQQHPGYEPLDDPLIGPGAEAVFFDDPGYPPANQAFEGGVTNVGPDADLFRDPETGVLVDASEWDLSMRSFTAHRSALGLAFDTARALAEPFAGDGFVLSGSGADSPLLGRMRDEGQDLLHLELTMDLADSTYSMTSTQIVRGFRSPIDAVLVGTDLYVIETAFSVGEAPSLWVVALPKGSTGSASEPEHVSPGELMLSIYPNPISSDGHLRVEMTVPGRVTVTLYDVRGRVAGVLIDAFRSAGTHVVPISGAALSPGVYIARMETDGRVGFHPFVRID